MNGCDDTSACLIRIALSTLPELRGRSGRLRAFFEKPHHIFEHPDRIPFDLRDRIYRPTFLQTAEQVLDLTYRKNWHHICFTSSTYPENFRYLPNPPIVLWVEGNPVLPDAPRLALVGSRHATSYGANALRALCSRLRGSNVTIVSGLAYGIDAYAHSFALESGIRTIAFVGHGLNHMYPSSNKNLRRKIGESGGSIVSEFPPDVPPRAPHFPIRNRLISAFSEVVCVVEAPLKSGALNTAHWALEQGKEVGAVPGSIFKTTSQGTNFLIARGYARAVTTSQELLDMFPDWCKPIINTSKQELSGSTVSPTEQWVLDSLDFDTPLSIEKLMSTAHEKSVPLHKIYHALFSLERKGHIISLPGKRYLRKK